MFLRPPEPRLQGDEGAWVSRRSDAETVSPGAEHGDETAAFQRWEEISYFLNCPRPHVG